MKTAVVILSAGAGRRLGGVAKALLSVGGQTYLERIVATARADEVVIVLGPPHADLILPHTDGMRVAYNPRPERGMASSVALGFSALDADRAWLWPVDHPWVQRATLDIVTSALADHEVSRPRYLGRGGHPPLIAQRAFAKFAACGEGGARAVIAACDVVEVPTDDPGVVRDHDSGA